MNDSHIIKPEHGLWHAKGTFNKTHWREQTKQLLTYLDVAIAATATPTRTRNYFLERKTIPKLEEARWERAMWQQWREQHATAVKGAWHRIVGCQVPLKEVQGDETGEIDLVAISSQGSPIVIELKRGKAFEYVPSSVLVQAAAYATVLRHAWTKDFGNEWMGVAAEYGFEVSNDRELSSIPLVGAAPREYWDYWRSYAKPEDWEAFEELVAALTARGYPATFVALDADRDEDGLPLNIQAEVLERFY